ncbi:GntR family transcriptional regulator [Streptomyces sp. RFCAC02]|uniref:GntR family transcriptional regulator n=1 Tax=Streptomyces sp. RFCAC02 TaxID=2499143 RepID=UPI0010227B0F|nr:GntR family transcriptional regulator [Streptomyces sp. RFCAC02]
MPDETPPPPAADRAYTHTKDAIISGRLAGGQMISEGQICEALGISRTPVHEAFLRLSAERLLRLAPRRGAVVAPMAPQEARDVLEMREAIEGSAARRLIADGGPAPAVAAALAANLEQQEVHAAAGDTAAFVALDEEFHETVVTASGNITAGHLLALIRDRQQRLRHQLLGVRPAHLPAVLDDHRRLVRRLTEGDADGYLAELSAHVARHRGAL